jgi:hypothetical protein
MRANGQCKFVMGAMLGFLWCAWAMVDMEAKPYNFLAKFIIGLWSILGLALIDQAIERRRTKTGGSYGS